MIKPSIFGKFILLERISVGGMAEVYRAKLLNQPQFGRYFALKRILPNLASDEEFIKMFVNEASVAVELEHPNVCQIYELGRLGSSHYIAMEYISGRDFAAIQNYYRRQKKIMSVSQACYLVAQAAQGLDYAHRAVDQKTGEPLNLIHRDISPQNLIAGYDGVVKLIDFGVAKASRRTTDTKSGALKGKFSYMSPEQAEDTDIDHRSDIFALGVIFWELLTGRRLFVSESEYAILEMIKECNIEKPSKYNRTVPDVVDRICMKALERDPKNRYQWASDMVLDLIAFINSIEPPYSMWHLETWLQTSFSDNYEEEKAKKAVFDTLNTEQDVEKYNRENAEKQRLEEAEAARKEAEEKAKAEAEKADAPKLPPVPGRMNEGSKESPKIDLGKLPSRKGADDEKKKESSGSSSGSYGDVDDEELTPEAVAPTVSDPEHLRIKRLTRKKAQRKRLTAIIITTCSIIIISMLLFLTGVISLPSPQLDVPTEATLSVNIVPEIEASKDAVVKLFSFPRDDKSSPVDVKKGGHIKFDHLEAKVYEIVVTMEGYESEDFRLTLENGESETRLELTRKKPIATEFSLKVTPEDAKVYVDGTLVEGSGDARALKGNIGIETTLRVVRSGYLPAARVVTPIGNDEFSIELEEADLSVEVASNEPGVVYYCDGVTPECISFGEAPAVVSGIAAPNDNQPFMEVRLKDGRTWKKDVSFEETPNLRLFADFKPEAVN